MQLDFIFYYIDIFIIRPFISTIAIHSFLDDGCCHIE
jgi:hypothetical protein